MTSIRKRPALAKVSLRFACRLEVPATWKWVGTSFLHVTLGQDSDRGAGPFVKAGPLPDSLVGSLSRTRMYRLIRVGEAFCPLPSLFQRTRALLLADVLGASGSLAWQFCNILFHCFCLRAPNTQIGGSGLRAGDSPSFGLSFFAFCPHWNSDQICPGIGLISGFLPTIGQRKPTGLWVIDTGLTSSVFSSWQRLPIHWSIGWGCLALPAFSPFGNPFSFCAIPPRARNTCIGRSGAWAGGSHKVSGHGTISRSPLDDQSTGVRFLLFLASCAVPFARGALCLLFCALFRLLTRCIPGRHTPLGKTLSAVSGGAPCQVLRAFVVFSPSCSGLPTFASHKHPKRPRAPRITAAKGFGPLPGGWATRLILSLFTLPILVRGASDGATALQQVHDAVTALQPEELTNTVGGSRSIDCIPPPERPEGVREPIQLSVARCQDEANLEAYGDVLDTPVLRACVLIPGQHDIIVRLASAEGDLRFIIEQVQERVSSFIADQSDLLPVSHQAFWGVLTLVAVPRWIASSLRTVVIFDLTAIGGPFFADIVWQLVYRSEVEALAAQHSGSRVNVYTQNCPVGWAAGTPYKLASGQVVQVRWPDTRPKWCGLPATNLWSLWTRAEPPIPARSSWKKWLIVREDGECLLDKADVTDGDLYDTVAEQIGSTVSQLCFQRDPSGFSNGSFTYRGRSVAGIIAVAPSSSGPREAAFTFVDARRVGRGIRAFLRQVWTDASSILRCVDPKVPDGYSATLNTRAWAGEALDDLQWDWQEVSFRGTAEVTQATLGASEAAPAVTDVPARDSPIPGTPEAEGTVHDSAGFYAAISTGPLEPAHVQVENDGGGCSREKIWFLLFAPDRTPEMVWISSPAPLSWEDAFTAVCSARDALAKEYYGHICRVHPQPSVEFASLICLPLWARQRTTILLDSRSFDGRLYCLTIDPWIQWTSFLLHTHLPDTEDFVVVVRGVAHVRGRPLVFCQGDMIQVIGYGAAIPPVLDLADLLFDGAGWEQEPPLAFSSSFSHFWVLHEGGSRGIDADYHKIDTVYGFQEFAADALQFAHYRTTLKTSAPRIEDAVYRGVLCKAVVLVTECLPTLPVPPARVTTPLTVVFLDMRPVMRGFEWRILVRGESDLKVFKQGLRVEVPDGFALRITGGSRATRHGVVFLQAPDRTVLTVSFADRTRHPASDGSDVDGNSTDSDTDSDNSSGGDTPDPSVRDEHPTVRSRSPRNRKARRRNRDRGGGGPPTESVPGTTIVSSDSRTPECFHIEGDNIRLRWVPALPITFGAGEFFTTGLDPCFASAAVACKILVEPTSSDSTSAEVIAHLRYAAPRLGFPWRYMTPANAVYIEDDGSSDSDLEVAVALPLRVCFRILVPGFAAEKVDISITPPTTVAEILPLVQVARC